MPGQKTTTDRGIPASGERLQNVLARRGVASRRRAAEMVAAGRVTVCGRIVLAPGQRVDPQTDEIRIDGHLLGAAPEPLKTILMHKPRGIVCSADNRQGRTVCDLVRCLAGRLVPAGRLDKASEGAILLSNDGALIQRLTHPRHGHVKRYEATVTGRLTDETIERLGARQMLDGYLTQPVGVNVLRRGDSCHTIELTLKEGRSHQVKRLCGRAGLFVTRLLRTEVAGFTLDGLHPGEWRELTAAETARLKGDG